MDVPHSPKGALIKTVCKVTQFLWIRQFFILNFSALLSNRKGNGKFINNSEFRIVEY